MRKGGRFYGDLAGWAMDRYAYYECFKCKDPYYGGEHACAAAGDAGEFNPEEFICGGCKPQAAQQDCPKHGTVSQPASPPARQPASQPASQVRPSVRPLASPALIRLLILVRGVSVSLSSCLLFVSDISVVRSFSLLSHGYVSLATCVPCYLR